MKNRKGFTLIELLAVIVILAIIMVIAVPQILNVIDSSRESAWNNSTKLVKKAIETSTNIVNPDTNTFSATVKDLCDNETNVNKNVTDKIAAISDVGDMSINCKKNTDYIFTLNGKNQFSGRSSTITCISEGKCSYSISSSGDSLGPSDIDYGTIVYFDPVSTNKCDSATFDINSIKNNSSTCYKWRIIGSDSNNLTVQMDHNLVSQVRWSTGSSNSTGPNNILTALASATVNWIRVPLLTGYTYDTTLNGTNTGYNYGVLTCTNGICNKIVNNSSTLVAGTSSAPVRARLITGEEVMNITQTGTWTEATSGVAGFYLSSGNRNEDPADKRELIKWLFENTTAYSSGATNNAYGSNNLGSYTLSPNYETTNRVWCINLEGAAGESYVYKTDACGARPVITMPKSYFVN